MPARSPKSTSHSLRAPRNFSAALYAESIMRSTLRSGNAFSVEAETPGGTRGEAPARSPPALVRQFSSPSPYLVTRPPSPVPTPILLPFLFLPPDNLFAFGKRAPRRLISIFFARPSPSSLSPRLPKRQNSLCLRGGDGRRKERDADVGSCVIPSPELCIFLFVTAASRRRRRRRRCQCGSTSGGDGRTGKGSAGGSRLHGSRRREFIENENEERRVNGGTTAKESSSGNGSPPRRCRQRLQAAAESYAAHFA